jgi:hypothetical protein
MLSILCQDDGLDESLLSEEAGLRGDDFPSEEPHPLHTASDKGIFQISKKIEMGEMAVCSSMHSIFQVSNPFMFCQENV